MFDKKKTEKLETRATTYDWYDGTYTWKYQVDESGNATIIQGISPKPTGELEIPEKIGEQEYPVTSIGNAAFYDCSALASVTIPAGVASIKPGAFNGCSGLASVTIPNSITSIGDYAFRGCSNLTNVTIPDSITNIGTGTFYYCSSLTNVTIPDSVTDIGNEAFRGCSNLTNVTIGAGVTSIGTYAFSGCASALYDTNSIPGVLLVDGWAVGSQSPSGDLDLTGIRGIGGGAFSGCSGLTSVIIPDSVTSIGSYAFSDCSGLTNMAIPDSVTSIDDATFSGCSGLTSMTIGDNVMSIGNEAFYGCSGLTSVTIPDSVTSIGTLGTGDVFYDCTSVENVYCYPNPKDLTWVDSEYDDFKPDRETICHVKEEYLDAYVEKFGPDSDEPLNVTFRGDLPEPTPPEPPTPPTPPSPADDSVGCGYSTITMLYNQQRIARALNERRRYFGF